MAGREASRLSRISGIRMVQGDLMVPGLDIMEADDLSASLCGVE